MISQVNNVLNTLKVGIPELVCGTAKTLVDNPDIINNISLLIIENKSLWLTKQYVYGLLGVNQIRENTTSAIDDNFTYKCSDKHIEFPMTEQGLTYLKRIMGNNFIAGRGVYFIHDIAPQHQNSLRNIIERSNNALFILAVNSGIRLDYRIRSLGMCINLRVSRERAWEYYREHKDVWGHEKPIDMVPVVGDGDIMNLYLKLLKGETLKTGVDNAICKFAETCKKSGTSSFVIIEMARELAYKLYHMNFPIVTIVLHITPYLHDAYKDEFIAFASEYEHLCVISKRDILTYEGILTKFVGFMKMRPPPKKSRLLEEKMADIHITAPSVATPKKKVVRKKNPT